MNTIIVLLMLSAVVDRSYCSGLDFGGHGGEGLTLGEISLDHHGSLGGLELGGHHSLDFLGGHSSLLNDVGGWHSSYGGIGASHGIIPVVKHVGVPIVKKVPISIPHPVVQTVPQPYPVAVVVPKPVPYEVEKPVIKTVEKKVPTPVEKVVPVKIEKPVPFQVVKHVPVPVVKPIPIKIPVYKTVVHNVKGH